jgi:3-oxoacyl-[acyl-carrier protein] reductase
MRGGDRLAGRVALVTGSGQGIGRAIALRFAAEGAAVICNDVVPDRADATARDVERCGRPALAAPADVADRAQVEAMVEQAWQRFGRLDILVNNAGIFRLTPPGVGPVEAETEESWDRVLAVNLKGVFLCCQRVLPIMKRQRYGRIVNLGSLAAKTGGTVSTAAYAVAKAGVICLTKCLAREGAPFGITANAVAPGQIDTEMTSQVLERRSRRELEQAIPLGRIGTPEDVAAGVLFLASEEAGYITGAVLDINGGLLMD